MCRWMWIVYFCFAIICSIMPSPSNAEPGWDRTGQTTTQNATNTKSRSKAAKEVEKPKTDSSMTDAETDALRRGAGIAFVVLASCTLILFVLGCGSRVVVFADSSDVLMAACIFLAPVVTVIATGLLAWMLSPDTSRSYATVFEAVKDNPAPAFVLAAGLLWWAWAIIGTLVSSIRYNGIVIGLAVSILKLGALVSLFIVWLGVLHNYDEEYNHNHTVAKVFLIGLIIWFASKMVNGDRVLTRRSMISGNDEALAHA